MKRQTSLLIIAILFAALISCSYENTATVTIDTGIRQQAHLSIWDKILAWVTFSKPLQADQPPQYVYFVSLSINVSAPDMNTISQSFQYSDILNNNGKIKIEVIAGSQRKFEIIAYDYYNDSLMRKYGGITTVDLSPGQQVTLNIEMGELINIYSDITYDNSLITIYSVQLANNNIIAFKLYRQPTGGDSVYFATLTNFSVEGPDQYNNYTFTIPIMLESGFSYYISAVNPYGEGGTGSFTY
ncbi:MAG: hypothetical protein WHV26_05785 [Spirochaetota bacterium]